MATIRQRPNGTFELRIVHRALPRPYYSTHDDRAAAERYAAQLVAALDRGDVPPELRPEVPRHIPRSKTGRARAIPLPPQYVDWVSGVPIPTGPEDFLFPFWDGTEPGLRKATNRLSSQFARVFEYAGCEDLTEHDLRHEAVCRWILMKDPQGRWLFRAEEVRRITGHLSVEQFERYLSLRGSDLADRLWDSN